MNLSIFNLYCSIITVLILILIFFVILTIEFCLTYRERETFVASSKSYNIWQQSKGFELEENKV